MSDYEALIGLISLTMGVGWASGINLYAALLVLGIGGATNNIVLPEQLQVLQDPMVIGAAGLMYAVEFFADKVPGVDTSWDALHTFIRIPAGALLAAGAVGDVTPVMAITAGIMGGGMATVTHATKSGTRLAANTSPEPFSNWSLSITEDIAVFAGLWAALNHPLTFVGLMVLFLVLAIWLLPKLWRLIRAILQRIGRWIGLIKTPENDTVNDVSTPSPVGDASTVDQLYKLKTLLDQGLINEDEFQDQKRQIVG